MAADGRILSGGVGFSGRPLQVLQRQNLLEAGSMADGGILSGRVSFVGRPLQVLQAQNLLVGCCRLVTGEFYPAELVLPAVRFLFREAKLAR